jgi:hypothetical protein
MTENDRVARLILQFCLVTVMRQKSHYRMSSEEMVRAFLTFVRTHNLQ